MSLKSRLRAVLSRVREFLSSPFSSSPPSPSGAFSPYTLSDFGVAFGVSSCRPPRLLNKSTGGQRSCHEWNPIGAEGRPRSPSPSPLSTNVHVPSSPSPSAIIQFQKWGEEGRESRPLSYFTTANRPNEIPPSPAAFLLTTLREIGHAAIVHTGNI